MQGQFGQGQQGSGFNPYASESPTSSDPTNGGDGGKPGSRPSDKYSDEEIMQLLNTLASPDCPPEMKAFATQLEQMGVKIPKAGESASGVGPDGKPILDPEGGTTIQPTKGFVVKTRDMNTGGKVFVNMTQHEFVDPFSTRPVPKEEAEQHGTAETGLRIPLSLGTVREESDKKGEPCQVYDVIWNPNTVEKCKIEPQIRQAVIELAFNYIQQKHK